MKHLFQTLFVVFLLSGLCFSQAAIQLSKSIGPPTSETSVSGQNFPANSKVNLYFASTKVGQTDTDATGSFSDIAVQVPKNALPGTHTVIAKATMAGVEAKARFLVRTNWPQYGFGPNGGRHNRFENVLNPTNVGKLALRFSYTAPAGLAPPVVAGGMVYFSSNDGNIYVLNADSGALVWKAEGSGPAVAGGIVYFTGSGSDTFLYARNAKTGALVWAYNVQIFASVPVVCGGVVYLTAATVAGYDLFALNARTGFLYWKTFIWNTPDLGPAAVDRGTVYVGASGSSGSDLLALSNGAPLWQYPIEVGSAPAVVNGAVYAGSGDDTLYALDANTGALLWKYSTTNALYSSPAVAAGVVYVSSSDGSLYALNAGTGTLAWKDAIFAGSPALANGVGYVASSDGNSYFLNALNAKTGALLWKYTFGLPPTDPVVANGMVYLGSEDGHLYAFGLPHRGVRSTSTKPHPHPITCVRAPARPSMTSIIPDF